VVDDESKAVAWLSITYPGAIKLQGWVGPRDTNDPIRFSFVAIDGQTFSATTASSLARSDVSAYLQDEHYAMSGFALWVDGSVVPPGRYRVVISLGDAASCDTGRTVAITGSADPRLAY
ncbi:MAG: hypothetical protein ABI451_12695, partial [Dokdonella sp.]